MMGRPADLGYQRIDAVEFIDDFDEIEVVNDNLQGGPWYVQVDAGDVRVLSSEQVRDFHRLGVILDRTFIWQRGMQQWQPLSNFLDEPGTPPKSAVHADPPTQPRATSRAPAAAQTQALRPAPSVQTLAAVKKLTAAQPGTQAAPRVAPAQTAANRVTAPAAVAPQRTTSAPPTKAAASTFEVDEDEPWSVLMGPGEVKTLSLEQLADFYRLEVIDDQTYVWQKGMPEWSQLATILGPDEEDASSEIWHVQMAPGEIKTLTLEQLDDFYRLDIIDEHTLVCQPGWPRAYPLGMVAGVEAEPARTAPVPIVHPAAAQSYAKPVAVSAQPLPAQPYTKPVAVPVSMAPQATAAFKSNAPVAFSIPVPEAPRRRGSWTVRLAIAAGVLLTLLRNDVVYSVADAVSQKGSYVQAEQRVLGGPIFGTTRAVDSLLAETGGQLKPVRLPWLVTETQDKKTQAAKQAAVAAAQAPKAPPPSAAPTQPEKAVETKTAAAAPAKAASNANVAAALTGAPPKKFASVKSVKPTAMPKGAKKASKGQNGPFTGKGAYGDPLAM